MIRGLAIVMVALVASVLGGWALARALVSWRAERRRRGVMLAAQREADLREQAARRESRERAQDALEDAEKAGPDDFSARLEAALFRVRQIPPLKPVTASAPGGEVTITLGPQVVPTITCECCGLAWRAGVSAPEPVEFRQDYTYDEANRLRTVTTTTRVETRFPTPEPVREHPLGWTVVGLPGDALCAVSPDREHVDRFDVAACGWTRMPAWASLHREAVAAVGR